MKRICTLFVFLACFLSSFAYDAVVDGIYYDLVPKAKIAKVTSGDNKYSGEVVIPEHFTLEGIEYTVTEIVSSAFANCDNLTSISIPNSVTYIGGYAFEWCRGLTSISIPNSVTNIGQSAFLNCEGITSVTISNSLTSISNGLLYG